MVKCAKPLGVCLLAVSLLLCGFGGVVAHDPIRLKLTPDVQFLYAAGGVRVILSLHNLSGRELKFHVCAQVPLSAYFSFIIRQGGADGREISILSNTDDVKFKHQFTEFVLKPETSETVVVNLSELLEGRQRFTDGMYNVKALMAVEDVVVESNEVMFELSKL